MPSPTGLPPPKRPRAHTGRDAAALAGVGGVRGTVTAISSAEMAPVIGPAALAGSGLLGGEARWLVGHRSARPNNQSSAAYHRASVAHSRRPTPSLGTPRAAIRV
jgi:hypothetical protein